jgi:hypothetical protein
MNSGIAEIESEWISASTADALKKKEIGCIRPEVARA